MNECIDDAERQRQFAFTYEMQLLTAQRRIMKMSDIRYDASFLDLRQARQKELRKKKCGASQKDTGDGVFGIDVSHMPRSELMCLSMPTGIDSLRAKVEKPIQSVPPQGFRKWVKLPLRYSIPAPNAPENFIVYSRGSIGQELKRPGVDFVTHNERVLQSPYTALHDPHAKNYFRSRNVREHLKKQGFITDKGEVICTSGDMNKYRKYLFEVTNGLVRNALEEEEKHRLNNIRQKTALAANVEDGKRRSSIDCRSGRSTFMKMRAQSEKYLTVQLRQQVEATRYERFLEKKEREQLGRIQLGLARDIEIQRKISAVKEKTLEKQRNVLRDYITKDIVQFLRSQTHFFVDDEDNGDEIEELDFLDAKMSFALAKYTEERQILETLENDNRERAIKRQKHAEWHRKMFPEWTRQRKVKEKRLWDIVRKYAMIWLKKVRARKNKPIDLDHGTVWIGRQGEPDPTEKALKDLKYQTGEKGLGDFVMSVFKMRGNIKAKIAKQEEKEAAKLAKEKSDRDAVAKALGTYTSKPDNVAEEPRRERGKSGDPGNGVEEPRYERRKSSEPGNGADSAEESHRERRKSSEPGNGAEEPRHERRISGDPGNGTEDPRHERRISGDPGNGTEEPRHERRRSGDPGNGTEEPRHERRRSGEP